MLLRAAPLTFDTQGCTDRKISPPCMQPGLSPLLLIPKAPSASARPATRTLGAFVTPDIWGNGILNVRQTWLFSSLSSLSPLCFFSSSVDEAILAAPVGLTPATLTNRAEQTWWWWSGGSEEGRASLGDRAVAMPAPVSAHHSEDVDVDSTWSPLAGRGAGSGRLRLELGPSREGPVPPTLAQPQSQGLCRWVAGLGVMGCGCRHWHGDRGSPSRKSNWIVGQGAHRPDQSPGSSG